MSEGQGWGYLVWSQPALLASLSAQARCATPRPIVTPPVTPYSHNRLLCGTTSVGFDLFRGNSPLVTHS